MIFVQLLVPLVVRIGLEIIGQRIVPGSSQGKRCTMLFLDLDSARGAGNFDITLEDGNGGIVVFHFDAKVGRLGEREPVLSKGKSEFFHVCRL